MSWSRFLRRGRWDADRARELESYVQIETDENIAGGMPPDAAREAALRKLGNRTRVREEIYRFNTLGALDTLARDLRYGFRVLRRNPTFAIAVLLTLSIGIGANTAVFSVVNSVLIKPLPYRGAERLIAVRNRAPGAPGIADVSGDLRLSPSMFFTFADENRVFEHIGIWIAGTASVTGAGDPEQVRILAVSEGTFEALGVPPLVGRWLSAADQTPPGAGPASVVLNYGYWQRRFGGDRHVVGRPITIDSLPREIVGVMPRGFRIAHAEADVIVPVRLDRSRLILPPFAFQGVARLKPGVTLAEASADVARMIPIWNRSWPAFPGVNPRVYEGWRITPALRPLKDDVVGGIANALWVLLGTIGIVMLIASANVANLLLVRADARQQELAVRAALGAGSWRITRELLLESQALSIAGGLLGVAVAYASVRALVAWGPSNLPRLTEISLDARALGFAVLVSMLSGLVFGLIPALKYGGRRLSSTLRAGGRAASDSRDRHRTRNALVVVQVALALVLLVSSGLMLRSFHALRTVEPGFTSPAQVLTVRLGIPATAVPDAERTARMQQEIVDKLATLPSVSDVGLASSMPMESITPNWDSITVEGRTYPDGQLPPFRLFKAVSPGYFAALGTRIVAGRDYTWTDLYEQRPVIIVSENLARELWGRADAALGKRIRQGTSTAEIGTWQEVVGVVEDVRENGAHEPAPATVYWASMRSARGLDGRPQLNITRQFVVAARSAQAGTEAFLNAVRQAIWSVNPTLPLASVQTMQEQYERSMVRTSFTLAMLMIAGTMALVLGVIGIYAAIAYTVSQRRREIGIRLALGAQHGALHRRFVGQGLILAGIGVAIGLGAAVGLTRLITSLLFGVSPLDPLTYLAVAMVLTIAAALASYLPARRASAVPPVEALAAE